MEHETWCSQNNNWITKHWLKALTSKGIEACKTNIHEGMICYLTCIQKQIFFSHEEKCVKESSWFSWSLIDIIFSANSFGHVFFLFDIFIIMIFILKLKKYIWEKYSAILLILHFWECQQATVFSLIYKSFVWVVIG